LFFYGFLVKMLEITPRRTSLCLFTHLQTTPNFQRKWRQWKSCRWNHAVFVYTV